MIYVASSWRNPIHIAVVAALTSAARHTGDHSLLPYDFRNPSEGNTGFHWSQVGMPSYNRETNGPVPATEYLRGINHPIAEDGFTADFEAMQKCDRCILVLPCGRSAHLEAGWFIGQGKPTAIFLNDEHDAQSHGDGSPMVVPELMYKMADYIGDSLFDLLGWAGVED